MTKACANRTRCGGMTLIETLVAVSVIGLLIGILLPAVMTAREAGRRATCVNNLHQIGEAFGAFQSVEGCYPAAAPGERDQRGRLGVPRNHSPFLQVLSYLDQASLARNAVLDLRFDLGPDPDPANATVVRAHVGVFVCPSESSPLLQGPLGPSSYRVNLGPGPYDFDMADRPIGDFPGGGQGAFSMGHYLRPQDFRDGLSHTVMAAEKLLGDADPGRFSRARDYWCLGLPGPDYPAADPLVSLCDALPSPVPDHLSDGGRSWYFAGFGLTWYNHTVTPNSTVAGCKVNGTDPSPRTSGNFGGVFGASSQHSGGVHCLMGDGSVHFVRDSINLAVWRALSTRGGGEAIKAPD